MQYLLLHEIDASQGGGTALGVVVPEAQTTTIEVIFKWNLNIFHFVNTYHFFTACVSLD